jgi:glycerol-3-phosphate dehydrogenase
VLPLPVSRARSKGMLSRDYMLVRGRDGVLSVLGGKLTLHRGVAEEVLAALGVRGGAPDPPLPGESWSMPRAALEAALARLVGEASAAHLTATYGGRADAIRARLERDPAARAAIVPGLPHLRAEIDHAVESELAVFADDFARRRTDFAMEALSLGIDPAAALAFGAFAAPAPAPARELSA